MSSAAGTGRGARERLRSLPSRTPLRVKLITALLALVIIALAVISITSRAVYSGYLMRQHAGKLCSVCVRLWISFRSRQTRRVMHKLSRLQTQLVHA